MTELTERVGRKVLQGLEEVGRAKDAISFAKELGADVDKHETQLLEAEKKLGDMERAITKRVKPKE